MARVRNEYIIAVENLKRRLREQKITYRELAAGIGMSESGIKKVLGASDGSFQRLADLCRFIGIHLSDLLEETQMVDVTFTEKQQQFLVRNMELFHLYWKLAYERASVESIRKEWGLSAKQSFRLLRQLDSIGLIRLLPGDRVRLPSIKAIRWIGDGPLIRKLYSEWSRSILDSVAKPKLPPERMFLIRYIKMKPKTYRELIDAHRAIEEEFVRRGIQEMRTMSADLQHVRWLVGIDDQSFVRKR